METFNITIKEFIKKEADSLVPFINIKDIIITIKIAGKLINPPSKKVVIK